MLRDIVLTVALFVLYFMLMTLVNDFLDRFRRLFGFKKLLASAPFSVLAGIIVIWISPLTFSDAGFLLGDYSAGLKAVLVGGLPVAVLTAASVLFASSDSIRKVRYGSVIGIKYQLIYSWIVVGIVEELLFRGFLQSSIDMFLPGSFFFVDYSVILSSVVFVFMHIGNMFMGLETKGQFWAQIPMRFLVSVILGLSFQLSGSLLYSIIIHNLVDGMNMSALIYRKKVRNRR